MKRGSVGHLLVANTFVWIAMATYTPFIGAYYTQQGISPMQIGILTAIGPTVSILIQPIWAYLSDRSGKRRTVLVAVSLGSAVTILGYLIRAEFSAYVVSSLVFTVFMTAVLPLSDALISNMAIRRNMDFAKIRMGGTVGFALVSLVLGSFLKEKPELTFVFGSMGFLILAIMIRTLPNDDSTAPREATGRGTSGKVFKSNQIYLVIFLAFAIQLGISIYGSFYSVYVITLGYNQSIVGLSSCISAMSEVPILFVVNRLLRRFGTVQILIFSVFMMAARLTLAGSGLLPLMLASQLFQCVTYMTTYYACIMFINENVLEGKISQGQSRLAIVQAGFGSVLGNILGGFLTERLGIPVAFSTMAVGMVIAGVIGLVMKRAVYKM